VFKKRYPEDNPLFIRRVNEGSDFSFETVKAVGSWFRVFPSNMREIRFLQMLPTHVHVLAPAEGDGLLVKASIILQLDR